MNARMSREMEAMMDLLQSQITRAISSAISDRIIPEIQNMVENLPLGQHGVEPGTSTNEEGIRSAWENANTRLTKKDSRSACDLRDHTDVNPYMVTGANELQQPIPEFLTGRIYSQPDLQRQKSTHDTTLDTTLPITEPVPAEQPQDPILRQLKAKIQNEDYSEELLQQDIRYKHYLNNLDRIVLKDEIVTRQYYDETGQVKYHQVLLPKHLLKELLQALHGTAHKHPGISKMLQEIRQKYYYPGIEKHVKNG